MKRVPAGTEEQEVDTGDGSAGARAAGWRRRAGRRRRAAFGASEVKVDTLGISDARAFAKGRSR